MKNNFKHIIALMLVLVMSFQMAAFVAADEAAAEEVVEEEVYVSQNTRLFKILNALGIFTVFENDKFDGARELTRAEAAAVVAHMVGLISGHSMEGKDMPYSDVEGNDPYSYEIYHMHRLGIMNGFGDTFKPYDSITEEQFVKVVVEALGYGAEAQSMGGYPHGYTITAGKYGVLDNVKFKGAVSLTEDVAVQIVYNALFVEKPSFISMENGGFLTSVGKTILEQYFDVTKAQGIMTRNKNSHIAEKDGTKNGVVQIGNEFYFTGKSDCEDFLGYNVEFFYKKAAEDTMGTILYAEPVRNEVLTIDAKDITAFSGGKYVYYTDNVERKVEVPKNADIIYNGASVGSGFKNYIPEIGNVTLIDNNEDGKIDVVSIVSYGIYFIEANNAYDGLLTSKDGKKVNYLEASWNVTDAEGQPLAGEYVARDDVLLLAVNEDKDIIQGFAVVDTVSGKIDTFYNQGKIKVVEIDGEEYKASSYCNADFGTKIKISNEVGFVVYEGILLVQVSPATALTESVGFLIDVGRSTGLEGRVMLRMLLQTGEVKIVNVAEKAKLVCYGKPDGNADDIYSGLSYDIDLYKEDGNKGTVSGSEATVRQPVIYKLNSAGEIIYLEIAPDHNKPTATSISDDEGMHMINAPLVNQWFTYHSGSREIHGKTSILSENGFVIVVPELAEADNYEKYEIYTTAEYKSSLTNAYVDFDTRTKPVRIYRTDNDIIGANIMLGHNLTRSTASGTKFLLDKIGESVTDDGVECYTLKSSDGTVYKTADEDVFTSVANLTEGDFVSCTTNSYGLVDEIKLVYDWENAKIDSAMAGTAGDSSSYKGGQAFMKRGNVVAFYIGGSIPAGTTAENVVTTNLSYADVSKYQITVYDSSRTRAETHVVKGSVGDIITYLADASKATSLFMTHSWGNPGKIIIYK